MCRHFNRGACSSPSCKFEHICFACQQPGHSSQECRKVSGKGATQDPPLSHHDPTYSDEGIFTPGPALCGSTPYAPACLYAHVTSGCGVYTAVDLLLSWGGRATTVVGSQVPPAAHLYALSPLIIVLHWWQLSCHYQGGRSHRSGGHSDNPLAWGGSPLSTVGHKHG